VAGGVREGACPGHNAIHYTRLYALVAEGVSGWRSTVSCAFVRAKRPGDARVVGSLGSQRPEREPSEG
jgi:hypothetical protein